MEVLLAYYYFYNGPVATDNHEYLFSKSSRFSDEKEKYLFEIKKMFIT